jgi:hypothetical protein
MSDSVWVFRARSFGPMRPGTHRVIVIEANREWRHHDFATLDEAREYVADVEAESDDDGNRPIARIYDERFEVV